MAGGSAAGMGTADESALREEEMGAEEIMRQRARRNTRDHH
jgi:hypothetical protein